MERVVDEAQEARGKKDQASIYAAPWLYHCVGFANYGSDSTIVGGCA